MINPLLVQEVFNQPWCIDQTYAQGLLMAAASQYFGEKITVPGASYGLNFTPVYAVKPGSGEKQVGTYAKGSVGIVMINGPIVQNSDERNGIKGTLQACDEFLALDADPNIVATVFYNNSGGGAVYAVKPLDDVMAMLNKPVVSFSKEILASAAYRLSARAKNIAMYHPQGIVGSIGTMASYQDIQPMLEKWGMKFQEYYATLSTLKNQTFNKALKGDGKALIENVLDPMNEGFINDIKNLRGDTISTKDKTIYQGETYLASKAMELGMIDKICSLEDQIMLAYSLGQPNTRKASTQNQDMKFPKLVALAGIEKPTQEQLDGANAELAEAGITGVAIVPESLITEAAEVTAANTQMAEKLTEVKAERDATKAENKVLRQKIAAAPAAAAPVVGAVDPVTTPDANAVANAKLAGMSHIKALDGNPMFMKVDMTENNKFRNA
jgi:ClpP class serine protease